MFTRRVVLAALFLFCASATAAEPDERVTALHVGVTADGKIVAETLLGTDESVGLGSAPDLALPANLGMKPRALIVGGVLHTQPTDVVAAYRDGKGVVLHPDGPPPATVPVKERMVVRMGAVTVLMRPVWATVAELDAAREKRAKRSVGSADQGR